MLKFSVFALKSRLKSLRDTAHYPTGANSASKRSLEKKTHTHFSLLEREQKKRSLKLGS